MISEGQNDEKTTDKVVNDHSTTQNANNSPIQLDNYPLKIIDDKNFQNFPVQEEKKNENFQQIPQKDCSCEKCK